MKLYQFAWGPYPRRVLIYLQEKGIDDIELVDVDVVAGETHTPAFLAINPTGTVPVLELDDGRFIRQSISVLEYLETRYPSSERFVGTTPEDQARTRDQLSVVTEAYHYAGQCTFQASPLFAQRWEQSAEAARVCYDAYLGALRRAEALAGPGPFFGGAAPSLADVVFFASEQYMRDFYRLRVPNTYERLEAIYQRFALRPSARPPVYPALLAELAPLPPLA